MKIVYASRTGNVQSVIEQLTVKEPLLIETGSETVSEPYLLITYTDGYGDIPMEVEEFLTNNAKYLRGVIVSGDQSYGEAYCKAGDLISEKFAVECLYKFENAGEPEDIVAIQKIIDNA